MSASPYRAALITGASSGIGEAFAQRLAADGLDLVLVARSEDKLQTLAKQLARVHARRVEVVPSDLTQPAAAERVRAAVGALGLEVDFLVNNAGFGTIGPFVKQDTVRERDEVLLNAAAVVDMTHAFLPGMLERKRGAIVNVASMAAFQPGPYMAVYAATKAFVLSFSEAIQEETATRGVRVVCLCPGPVDTGFFEATGVKGLRDTVPERLIMKSDAVVDDALRALSAGRSIAVPGALNRVLATSTRLLPRRLLRMVAAQVLRR